MVMGSLREEAEVVVIGAGPGGYVAAIRAADLGKNVVIVDDKPQLGGTCLLEGCIPSKTLINAVELMDHAKEAAQFGLSYTNLSIDENKLREFTDKVVNGLSAGINVLLEKRGVEIIHGRARFESSRALHIEGGEVSGIDFRQAIIATGSRVAKLPMAEGLPVWYSNKALKLPRIPKEMVVIGGGYIGLELGLVYAGLGSEITVVEFMPHLLTGADEDMTDVVMRRCRKKFKNIMLESKVAAIEYDGSKFKLKVEKDGKTTEIETDQVLIAVGRKPNTDDLGLEKTKVKVSDRGVIRVTEEQRTDDPNIFAIGDVTPGPMLAHKAAREAKIAAEVIAGHPAAFDNRAIPAVVFTEPEMAWTGLSETEAKAQNVTYEVGKFPLKALGRARTIGQTDGFVKILFDPKSKLVLGVGIVGAQASELIAEPTLALEMGATLEDLTVTIHPHPTLSESLMEAAEVASGEAVHILKPK
ncbi:MAG: dihydrolipoyl dehydrogenase [FCB group bacterium]|nr:dihydrolipoyl dehydrogenase [FCB group bacterium]